MDFGEIACNFAERRMRSFPYRVNDFALGSGDPCGGAPRSWEGQVSIGGLSEPFRFRSACGAEWCLRLVGSRRQVCLGRPRAPYGGPLTDSYAGQGFGWSAFWGMARGRRSYGGYGGLCPHPPKGQWPTGLPSRCGGVRLVRSGALDDPRFGVWRAGYGVTGLRGLRRALPAPAKGTESLWNPQTLTRG